MKITQYGNRPLSRLPSLTVEAAGKALSFEPNWPVYRKRWGVRILNPFRLHGAGLHIGPVLIHLHTTPPRPYPFGR